MKAEKPRLTRTNPILKQHARQLRSEMTNAERLLWRYLRQEQIGGFKFRRQHPLGRYILDFVCLEAKVVIEADGGQHAQQADSDGARSAWLETQGFRVLRFWNNDVLGNIEGVTAVIREVLLGGKI